MYSLKYENIAFNCNSDLSGDVIIRRFSGKEDDASLAAEIAIPGDAILYLVAQHVRDCRISVLEDMDTEKLLGIAAT